MSINIAVRCMSHDLPLKAQVKTVKNMGTDDIYILSMEYDIPFPSNTPLPPVCIRLQPGDFHDVRGDVNFYYPPRPGFDKEITIHSLSDIDVDIESDVFYDTYLTVANHPWNGGPLPNGDYTEKYKNPMGLNALVGNAGIFQGAQAQLSVGGSTIIPATFVDFTIDIVDYNPDGSKTTKECLCTSRTLFNSGCICGHVKKQKWGI